MGLHETLDRETVGLHETVAEWIGMGAISGSGRDFMLASELHNDGG